MKKLAFLIGILSLSGCSHWNDITHWDSRTEGEKVAIVVGATVIAGALIIRNGQGNTQSQFQEQCIGLKSLQTGCHR